MKKRSKYRPRPRNDARSSRPRSFGPAKPGDKAAVSNDDLIAFGAGAGTAAIVSKIFEQVGFHPLIASVGMGVLGAWQGKSGPTSGRKAFGLGIMGTSVAKLTGAVYSDVVPGAPRNAAVTPEPAPRTAQLALPAPTPALPPGALGAAFERARAEFARARADEERDDADDDERDDDEFDDEPEVVLVTPEPSGCA